MQRVLNDVTYNNINEKNIFSKSQESSKKTNLMSKGPTEPEPEMIGIPVIEVPIELIENEYSKYEYLLPDNTTFSGWYDDFTFIMGYHLNSVDISNISSEIFFTEEQLPNNYRTGKLCAHVLHSQLQKTMSNTIHLTLHRTSDSLNDDMNMNYTVFAKSFIFHNPLWDLGSQFSLVRLYKQNAYHFDREDFSTYTSTCVCPCSHLLRRWHEKYELNSLPNFHPCYTKVYRNIVDFIKHVHDYHKTCNYHYMIMCAIQTNYASLICNLKFQPMTDHIVPPKFSELHKDKVRLIKLTHNNAKLTFTTIHRWVFLF